MKYAYKQLQRILRPGDVILVHGNHLISKIIRIITLSYWNHVVMYVGKNKVVQSDNGGVVISSLSDFTQKDIAIYRHRKATKKQLQKACDYATKRKGGYDWVGLVQLALLLICGIRGNVREIGWRNNFICSELVASAYENAGLRLTKYDACETAPSDIDISEKLRRL